MPLKVGNEQANTGMAGAVFEALDAKLRPPLEEQLKKQPNMTPQKIEASIKESQNAWRKLSFALAQGIVTFPNHPKSKMV